ncbi:hypothetical protein G7047_04590 [Diaphorobacter sp. HDW4A]|uniref:hypothetical protein n=1 Tax=Diaphorobacter sp. HDW4A TaxID=2714924 RepID=UPI00140B86FC|nr:hypothetical protein [Diaphorobacter sp. HDW4A]QIL79262.1 hypothetical protein G7047_04590 [Diaphorobacter sp. HDW4A]
MEERNERRDTGSRRVALNHVPSASAKKASGLVETRWLNHDEKNLGATVVIAPAVSISNIENGSQYIGVLFFCWDPHWRYRSPRQCSGRSQLVCYVLQT